MGLLNRFGPTLSSVIPRAWFGFVVSPQQTALVVERFGKYKQTLNPGLNWIIPVVDRVAYAHSLKEESVSIPNQVLS